MWLPVVLRCCRVHALYAQLQLQRQQQPAVDVALLNGFLDLLRRCVWTQGGPFSPGPQEQPRNLVLPNPLHVSCHACLMQPIVGPRFRSSSNHAISLCGHCVEQPAAAADAPYEEMKGEGALPTACCVPDHGIVFT
jgi:hypothetical protein